MQPSTRTHYRDLVAQVAERARAILPEAINGRLDGAVKLVLAHDVTPEEDGSITVGSCTDPLKSYRLEGQTCTCKDFTDGQAPDGWCRHRLAAGIHKRVREVLAAQLPPPEPPAPSPAIASADTCASATALPEAPASVNCHITVAGRQVQLTLRDTDEARLLARLEEVLQRYPVPQPPASREPQAQAPEEQRWCPKHGDKMQINHKDGRSWWSHRHEGSWCKGK
jgi:hypothetical protein